MAEGSALRVRGTVKFYMLNPLLFVLTHIHLLKDTTYTLCYNVMCGTLFINFIQQNNSLGSKILTLRVL